MEKTVVALSGGIDSLVTASLLKEKGHHVLGVHFMTGFEAGRDDADDPGAGEIRTSAAKAAHLQRQLNIEVHLLDCTSDFRQTVVSYFTGAYQAGKTPNPCLVCNPAIKFGILLEWAGKQGATYLATGHYARVTRDASGRYHLLKGVDTKKDQSYFLARLDQEKLAQACFPLGVFTKEAVRQYAAKHGLKPTVSAESQDVCFISEKTYRDFLAAQPGFAPEAGEIQDTGGKVLGMHEGLFRFTVGQRRGINCPACEPYYVIRLDADRNRLIVGSEIELMSPSCRVSGINWIDRPPTGSIRVQTRIRYRHLAAPSRLTPTSSDTANVTFETSQKAITPGQGAVFYQEDEVLGGGWIV